jgi:gluconolactonase
VSRTVLYLLFVAFPPVGLFTAERLQPVEVTRFRSISDGIVFDYDGNAYVSHGRFITRVAPDGKKSLWSETGAPEGHKILPDGTHLVCDVSRRAVLRLDREGKVRDVVSSECDGKPLSEPNDLTLDSKGGFYFTDSGGERDQRIGAIYYVNRSGVTSLAASGLRYPQGIVLRPDGRTILVAESDRRRILSYDVVAIGKLGPMKVFADLEGGAGDQRPDGLCLDQHGNLYIAHYGMGAVEVYNRKGRFIRHYPAGLLTANNLAFGGPKLDQLYITGAIGKATGTQGALYRLPLLDERGLPLLPRGTR